MTPRPTLDPRSRRRPASPGVTSHLAWGVLGGLSLCVAVVGPRVDSWVLAQGTQHGGSGAEAALGRHATGALTPTGLDPANGAVHAALPDVDADTDLNALLALGEPGAPTRAEASTTKGSSHGPSEVDLDRRDRESSFGFDFQRRGTGATRQRPTDGGFLEHYGDGALAVEGQYQDGERAGEWSSWHPDGALQLEGQYEDGRRVGRWKAYHPNGQLLSEGQYQGGEREGQWVTYYSNGQIKEQGLFEGGLRTGPWQFFDRFGQLEARSGTYRHGRLLN